MSELVTNAYLHAATDIDLSLARLDDRLRLAVRDGVRTLPTQREPDDELTTGRGLLLVEGCSRAWGVLPTAGEGKVVWAVLDV